jgi:hypothetical protein
MKIKAISALSLAAVFAFAACAPQDTTVETEAPAEETNIYEIETTPAEPTLETDTLILEGEEIERVDEVDQPTGN